MWVDKPPDKNPAPRTLPVHHHPSYLHPPTPPTWVQLSTRCTHHPCWHSRLPAAAQTRTPPLLLPPPVAAVDRQRRRVITTNSSNQSFPPRQKSRLEKTRTQLVSRCVRYTYTGCIIFIALSRKLNSRLGKFLWPSLYYTTNSTVVQSTYRFGSYGDRPKIKGEDGQERWEMRSAREMIIRIYFFVLFCKTNTN